MKHTFFALAFYLLLFSSLASAQTSYDFDRSTDFSAIKTYAWQPGTDLKFDEIAERRLTEAVDRQLAAKGLTKVAPDQSPDVYVHYHALFNKAAIVSWVGSTVGGGWTWADFDRFSSGSARVEDSWVGTIAIDLVDAKAHYLVWRGVARKEINLQASPEKRDKEIDKGAEKLFKNYPPKKKS